MSNRVDLPLKKDIKWAIVASTASKGILQTF